MGVQRSIDGSMNNVFKKWGGNPHIEDFRLVMFRYPLDKFQKQQGVLHESHM